MSELTSACSSGASLNFIAGSGTEAGSFFGFDFGFSSTFWRASVDDLISFPEELPELDLDDLLLEEDLDFFFGLGAGSDSSVFGSVVFLHNTTVAMPRAAQVTAATSMTGSISAIAGC
mmetsp:Transcript_18880/g.31862  ORF Transcript_18880/g.31862 Transcript_18880/m.31862 type:complete len:118 (-) Transcript_18880:104-457(-)